LDDKETIANKKFHVSKNGQIRKQKKKKKKNGESSFLLIFFLCPPPTIAYAKKRSQ